MTDRELITHLRANYQARIQKLNQELRVLNAQIETEPNHNLLKSLRTERQTKIVLVTAYLDFVGYLTP